ncbi:MAG: hypothetical protein HY938_00435 [Nitrosomonadales bacterium]|nr:hypothetical protein [Nitrosomonadales bacterium]
MAYVNNSTWQITGRTRHGDLPDDWRERLAARLGQRPRRIGMLAELALYGALDCLDAAQESALPEDVVLRLCSLRGAVTAIGQVLEQNRQDLPMPFSFLQSQTGQLLPALASALNWQGDAGIVMARDPASLALLAAQQAGPDGMLLGWVEEAPRRSDWLRLARCDAPPTNFVAANSFAEMISPDTRYWRLGNAGMEIARGQT